MFDFGTDRHRYSRPLGATCHERLATLIDKDVGPLDPVSPLLPVQELETVHLIPLQVMNAISASLEPAHDNGALPQVDVIPAQTASLRRWISSTTRARHSTWQARTALSFMRLFTSCALKMSAQSARAT
jgi:hypothetical protein